MEEITEKEFEQAKAMVPKIEDEDREISEAEIKAMLEEMENPVKAQQHLAIQIKIALDVRIKKEMKKDGYLSEYTRRWVESYNNILDKIQKSLHGDKSINLHLHKVSHSDISTKIRESVFDVVAPKDSKKKK